MSDEYTPAAMVELSTHAIHLLRDAMGYSDPSDPPLTLEEKIRARGEFAGYVAGKLWG